MSIGNQIHAFLKVSEFFLLQPAISGVKVRESLRERRDLAHQDHMVRLGAWIAHNAKDSTGSGGNGNQGSGAVPKRL